MTTQQLLEEIRLLMQERDAAMAEIQRLRQVVASEDSPALLSA